MFDKVSCNFRQKQTTQKQLIHNGCNVVCKEWPLLTLTRKIGFAFCWKICIFLLFIKTLTLIHTVMALLHMTAWSYTWVYHSWRRARQSWLRELSPWRTLWRRIPVGWTLLPPEYLDSCEKDRNEWQGRRRTQEILWSVLHCRCYPVYQLTVKIDILEAYLLFEKDIFVHHMLAYCWYLPVNMRNTP